MVGYGYTLGGTGGFHRTRSSFTMSAFESRPASGRGKGVGEGDGSVAGTAARGEGKRRGRCGCGSRRAGDGSPLFGTSTGDFRPRSPKSKGTPFAPAGVDGRLFCDTIHEYRP